MKKIGTTDGGTLVEIGAEDVLNIRSVMRLRVQSLLDALDDVLAAIGVTDAVPATDPGRNVQSAAPKPVKPETKLAKPEIAAKAKPKSGHEIYHRCEGCDTKLPADAAPQRKFCDACVKARKNACPSMQKRKAKTVAPSKPGTRTVKCETCQKPFEARLFGPVPHHCQACRPGGKKTTAAVMNPTAAPQAAALPKPVAAHRPPMPSDDAGKAARLEAIRRVALREARELEADVIAGATEN